jgi:hypothetical protein
MENQDKDSSVRVVIAVITGLAMGVLLIWQFLYR